MKGKQSKLGETVVTNIFLKYMYYIKYPPEFNTQICEDSNNI